LFQVLLNQCTWTSALTTARVRGIKAGTGTFTNNLALELGNSTEYGKDETAPSGGGVNVLRQRLQSNTSPRSSFHSVEQLAGGAGESIQLPDNQRIAGAHEI
jgi:hypothetical protein